MRSFLLKDKQPIVKYSLIPDECYFEGEIPEGYNLGVAPSIPYIILDVDVREDKNGFEHIPKDVMEELNDTFNYHTSRGGRHYWMNYTGNEKLMSRATKYGLDLRVPPNTYVKFPLKDVDIRDCIHLIKETGEVLNMWLKEMYGAYTKTTKK